MRWVYLDIGKFHGLAETIDESIRYPIRTPQDRDEMAPCIIAGPTCDSVDVLYEKNPYPLPVSLAIGDKVLIEATGAYTDDLFVGRLQRLPAAAAIRDLTVWHRSPDCTRIESLGTPSRGCRKRSSGLRYHRRTVASAPRTRRSGNHHSSRPLSWACVVTTLQRHRGLCNRSGEIMRAIARS